MLIITGDTEVSYTQIDSLPSSINPPAPETHTLSRGGKSRWYGGSFVTFRECW
jgi:hypothetical protein